ncbi:MAG: hemerythrin domain-containing protein [Thermoanaerobaculia bacterium]
MNSTRPIAEADESGARTFEDIAAEHRALVEALEALEGTHDPGELRLRLAALRGLLEQHYAGEEAADGLPGVIDANAPHLVASMQRIFDEHRQFLLDLEQLGAEARACVDRNAGLHRGITGLVDRLRDHERRETSLVSDAVNTDIGQAG